MKFNKWTYGLAAVGAVSLTSAARADEAQMSQVQTALSNTTISGYVSASANVTLDPNGAAYANSALARSIPFQGVNKQDGFNLDVVKVSISKPQDESPWASGYQVDLLFGPDAVGYNTSVNSVTTSTGTAGTNVVNAAGGTLSDFGIKQAYITLRTPIGNGIDWKIGVFDTIIGYEVFDAGSNPNYTRSYGYAVEPTEHTGVLGTYKINDMFTVSAGVANTLSPGINLRNTSNGGPSSFWKKTVMGSVAMTAPSDWGWAAGSMLYAGAVYGFSSGGTLGGAPAFGGGNSGFAAGDQLNVYAGATLNTPWKALTVGAAFDYVQNLGGGSKNISPASYTYGGYSSHANVWVAGLYATYKATDKLSISARGEYVHGELNNEGFGTYTGYNYHYTADIYSLTGTVQYDLWANVVSRLEIRLDHLDAAPFNATNPQDVVGLYANVIYKF